jgi:hypothetical protein
LHGKDSFEVYCGVGSPVRSSQEVHSMNTSRRSLIEGITDT